MTDPTLLRFPEGFFWGTATAAYQIEGAWNQAGRGPSIWDSFCRVPGAIRAGENGDVASDHYHRWQEDLGLMSELGVNAYRFSIAWPRILPDGVGAVNAAGPDFYDRLVDGLLSRGITPFVTLYHWDLPQALQDRGGWANRATAQHFADYARIVADRLGDRVTRWMTHNEPFVAALVGHLTGEHAPGLRSVEATFAATHHLLLAHGLAVAALRAAAPRVPKVGLALSLDCIHPASDTVEDQAAALRWDGLVNRLYLDPLFRGRYPDDTLALAGPAFPTIQAGDLATISAPLDFVGINYYTREVIRHDANEPVYQIGRVNPVGNDYSMMWEIYPPGLNELLTRVTREYAVPSEIYITENGIPVPDGIDADGRVRDVRRVAYLQAHIAQVHQAIAAGLPIRGYFVWSLLDNFEWAQGYHMRFGLIHVDFATQTRTIKDSGRWFRRVIDANGLRAPRAS
ncbi:MAG: beta-glucosidase [Anaerolineales bacterium]|nr:beta-glucosidase [Anaerolineales bacterium]